MPLAAPLLQAAPAASAFSSLQASPRMPVLFVGHGSPMNAIEDNDYRRSWQALGQEFGQKYPRPQLIVCISAHWLTRGWWLTAMARPKTIHDFGGFPQDLFDQQYPAPGAPATAREISKAFHTPGVGLETQEWGLDHGTWSVLKPMFPGADVPVVQLSMDYDRPAAEHFALGQQLKTLRRRGVLIVGSGNVVHNLRAMRRDAGPMQAHDWAFAFDKTVLETIDKGNLPALRDFQQWGNMTQMAHPTFEHYLPLLYAAGAVDGTEPVRHFNSNFQGAAIAMRSIFWG